MLNETLRQSDDFDLAVRRQMTEGGAEVKYRACTERPFAFGLWRRFISPPRPPSVSEGKGAQAFLHNTAASNSS